MNKKNRIVLLSEVLFIGLMAKCLSLLTKILMTRELGLEAMSIFSLVNPLILLLLTLSSLSLQNAIGSAIAKKPEKRKIILLNALAITIIVSSVLVTLLGVFSYPISKYLLKNINTLPCVIASIFVIPLTSISSIIKGYFLGINELKLTSFSQIFEECGRLLFIIIMMSLFSSLDTNLKASIAVFSLCVGEVFQILYMVLFYKNTNFSKIKEVIKKKKNQENYYQEILRTSIPMTLSRLVGSLTYFVEPIIFTSLMLKTSQNINDITISYGILNSYALPLLLMPGFISVTLSNLLIPTLGKYIRSQNYTTIKKYILKIISICFIIGLSISLIFFFFSTPISTLIYGKPYGDNLIKKYSLFFVIYYIETPIITCLTLFNMSKEAFKSTVISSILRIVLMILLVEKMKIDGLCIAIIASTYIDVLLNSYYLITYLFRNNKSTINLQKK